MSNKQAPVHHIRLSTISVAIFENHTSDGKVFYNTQFNRSYHTGDSWKQTRSFGKDDLLSLAKLADLAHDWIHERQTFRADYVENDEAA